MRIHAYSAIVVSVDDQLDVSSFAVGTRHGRDGEDDHAVTRRLSSRHVDGGGQNINGNEARERAISAVIAVAPRAVDVALRDDDALVGIHRNSCREGRGGRFRWCGRRRISRSAGKRLVIGIAIAFFMMGGIVDLIGADCK